MIVKNKEIRELLRIGEIIDFKDRILEKNPPWRTGRIIGLYKHFVLIQGRHYKTAANYFDIKAGNFLIRSLRG